MDRNFICMLPLGDKGSDHYLVSKFIEWRPAKGGIVPLRSKDGARKYVASRRDLSSLAKSGRKK